MSNVQAPSIPDALQEIACKCDKKAGNKRTDTCREQGVKKHECCEKEIQKLDDPSIGGEQGYRPNGQRMKMTREEARQAGKLKGTAWPDACTQDANGNPTQFFDFKFKCPKGSKSRRKKKGGRFWIRAKGEKHPTLSPYQRWKYNRLSKQRGIDPKKNPPTAIDTSNC